MLANFEHGQGTCCGWRNNVSRHQLTFKSIATILSEAEASGSLKRFLPVFDGDECEKRRLYLSNDVHSRLYEHPASQTDYWANVRAELGVYVKGEPIPDDETFFKQLDPKGDDSLLDIWEIRILLSPQSRLFGAFAAADCFVVFTARLRNKCPFDVAMKTVRDSWYELFGGHRRYSCWPLEQCITNLGGCP
jgi:hypothetical protein